MKQLNFKKIKANNFFCFGDKGVEIDFENFQNIVLIKGINKDVVDQNGKFSSNGSGKSTIPQILTYCFYGKTIKSPKKISHRDIVNNKTGKKLSVEVIFDEYRIVRTRKPDSLRIWKSKDEIWDESTEITLGGMPATQELINNIIGLSYESFLNVCVFTDDNNSCFLELDAADKRKIVENLLNLEKYRNYLETSKEMLKENKTKIKTLTTEISYIEGNKKNLEFNINSIEENIKRFEQNIYNQIYGIDKNVERLRIQLENSSYEEDLKKYKEAQEKIKKIDESLDAFAKKREDVINKSQEILKRYNDLTFEKTNIESSISEIKSNISFVNKKLSEINSNIKKFENLEPNMTCDKCFGIVKPENYQEYLNKYISEKQIEENNKSEFEKKIEEIKPNYSSVLDNIKGVNESILSLKTFSAKLTEEDNKLKNLKNSLLLIEMPQQTDEEKNINDEIEYLHKEKAEKMKLLEEDNPNKELLEQNKTKLSEVNLSQEKIKNEIIKLEELNSYYDFWLEAFGDEGIRRIVVNEIIPALNSKLAYWLQILIDNKIELKFDDSLNEVIVKYPDEDKPLIYSVLSNGQKRRINLAVNQAFAHVMMLSHGISPNIIFLDEVTSNIDQIGVQAIYNMICELSKNKKVFVTTHDQDLISMLSGCQEITLEMENGQSFLKSI